MRVVRLSYAVPLDGVTIDRFSVLVCPIEGVFEAGVAYLRELAVVQGQASGTVYDVAGILAAWVNWLAGKRTAWDRASPAQFIIWAKGDETAGRCGPARQRRRADVVFRFYEYVDRRLGAGWAVRDFVAELSKPIDASYGLEKLPVRRTHRLGFGRGKGRSSGLRPTPNDEEVTAVLNALLGDGSSVTAVRNWLMAQTAASTGLRREGLAQLTVQRLDEALRKAGLMQPTQSIADVGQAARVEIRRNLIRLEEAGGQNIILEKIREKGKLRAVSFPIALVRQLLDFVWVDRANQIRIGAAGASTSKSKGALWISSKTGRALTTGAVSDIIADGFRAAKVAGSPHRLRAAYCVALFRRLIREATESGGTMHHAETLLQRVAEHMGHANPESLRPYLHTAQLEELMSQNTTTRATSSSDFEGRS